MIASRRADIERRWLARVQADLGRTPEVGLTQLRDGIPDYLAALAELLSAHGRTSETGASIWQRIARHHAITRVRTGFDIAQLIHEFTALRQEIRAVAVECGLVDGPSEELTDLIEAAVTESIRAYVSARDYESRRVQAENIAFITHELRNPLSAAMGAAEMIREQACAEQQRALELLTRSHRRLRELIDSVLAVERLEGENVDVRIVDVREGDLLAQATEAAGKAAQAKGLLFDLHCDPDRELHLDPALTRSAIENLVDNAVKYTDSGKVEVVTRADETTWTLHVCDTCPGLSAEELTTIFEPFRRGKTAKQGTGLGLSIARRAIQAQGGSIHAESPRPLGCHFWITLPIEPPR